MKVRRVLIFIAVIFLSVFIYLYLNLKNAKTQILISNMDIKRGLYNSKNEIKHWLPKTTIGERLGVALLGMEMKYSKIPSQKAINNDTYMKAANGNGAALKTSTRKDVKSKTLMKNNMKQEITENNNTKLDISNTSKSKLNMVTLSVTKSKVTRKMDIDNEVTAGNDNQHGALRSNNNKTELLLRNKTNSFIKDSNINTSKEFTDPGKWIILVTVNNGFYDMFENWWWHFKNLKVTVNVTVIAEDDIVYHKLKTNYTNQYVFVERSWVLNISSALDYNTDEYHKMVSTRPAYMLKYLEESINVLYVDIDTIFLNNPFQHFMGDFDMWAQVENHGTVICSGFIAIRHSNKTVNAMRKWHSKLSKHSQRNQPALNQVLNKSDLKINRLNESAFVGGPAYSGMSEKQRSEVVLLHATYSFGHQQKYNVFKKWKLWALNYTNNKIQ